MRFLVGPYGIIVINIRSKWIIDYLKSYQEANRRDSNQELSRKIIPICGFLFWKLNADAAWSSCPPSTGLGSIIIRDSEGVVCGVVASFSDVNFPLPIVELMAIQEGIRLVGV